jgi:hypothetical protein
MTRAFVLAGVLLAMSSPAGARTPAQVLEEASNQFAYGKYAEVVNLLRPVVERGLLPDRADRIEALRLYGVCLHLTGRRVAAVHAFRALVLEDPKVRLDPRLVPPEVVAAFEAVRQERLRELREAQRRAQRPRYAVLNLIPSAGQFQNGHWRKGAVVLTAELALLAANLASYYLLRSPSLRQADGTFIERDAGGQVVSDRRGLAKALMGINYASLGLLLGTVVYGFVDGFVYHGKARRARARLLRDDLVVVPIPTAGGAGLGLGMTF